MDDAAQLGLGDARQRAVDVGVARGPEAVELALAPRGGGEGGNSLNPIAPTAAIASARGGSTAAPA